MPSIKQQLKQQLKSLPKPTKTSSLIDWLTFEVRPTHDPVRLFADKGYSIREKKDDEQYKKMMRGYKPENRFKVFFHKPINTDKGIRPGIYDALYRQEFRQKKLLPWYSGELETTSWMDVKKIRDLEDGNVTKSRFGDSVLLDFEAGYYDGEILPTDIRDFSEPVKKGKRIYKDEVFLARNYEECLYLGDRDDCYYSIVLPLSGSALRDIDGLKLIRDFGEDARATRIDVTLDLQYKSYDDLYYVQGILTKACGLTEKDGVIRQDPDKSLITAGFHNAKSPVRKAAVTASNGQTLYIGSRQSPFFVRIYDKSAEIESKKGKQKGLEPTLRFEIECKADLADSIYKFILDHDEMADETQLAELIWSTTMAAYLTIDGKNIADIVNAGTCSPAPLIISTFDTTSQRLSDTLRRQYGPKMLATVHGLSDADKIAYCLSCFGLDRLIPKSKAKREKFFAELGDSLSNVDGIVDEFDEYDLEHRK